MDGNARAERRNPGGLLSRRDAVKCFGLALAGIAAGCTPARVLLHAYPEEFDEDRLLVDRVLRAFVATVVPGAPMDDPNLVRVFCDEFYPFAPYVSFFAADLCRRSLRRYKVERFDALTLEQRIRVIRDGLRSDSAGRKLYNGAIFLTQLSFYSGIYDASAGCALIDFDGCYQLRPLAELSYPNPERYLAEALSGDGNYA